MTNDDRKTVVAATFTNDFNANLALTKLRDAGINCTLTGETIANMWSGAIGMPFAKIRLLVFPEDLSEAQNIIQDLIEQ